ncbi:hypothetical protein DEI83_06405 [Curtobacterium sp. MCBD17_021]|nr:hypothetical protein DEI83_06405 [Curtobacterium sp. MCBD17_021]
MGQYEQLESLSIGVLRTKLTHRRERLALAEAAGRPGHIARCRERVEALEIKVRRLEQTSGAREDAS